MHDFYKVQDLISNLDSLEACIAASSVITFMLVNNYVDSDSVHEIKILKEFVDIEFNKQMDQLHSEIEELRDKVRNGN